MLVVFFRGQVQGSGRVWTTRLAPLLHGWLLAQLHRPSLRATTPRIPRGMEDKMSALVMGHGI